MTSPLDYPTLSVVMTPTVGRDHLDATKPLPGAADVRDIPLVVGSNMITLSWNGAEQLQYQLLQPGRPAELWDVLAGSTLGHRRMAKPEIVGTQVPGSALRIVARPRRATVATSERAVLMVFRDPTPP